MTDDCISLVKKPLPTRWPSIHHHKCSNSRCSYPNPPQAVPGNYACTGRTGDVNCQGQYKVSKGKALGVDIYWRDKFVEDSKDHQQERCRQRKEEAETWEIKKAKQEQKKEEIARRDEASSREETRRREARWKLDADQQKLQGIDARLKEIAKLTRQLERVRVAEVYDPELGLYRDIKSENPRVVGLRQEWDFLLDEYNSLLHSVEDRRRC